ncbi:hypothetical protein [Pseudomonas sp. MPC6]|uniref:hypothetical protein n=1 Tax=unclassified Pseudomonas TaxID=196821 RepID=UPI001375558D|nr:hypothetical protein [Pseudomonas sp. MPC6]
MKMVDGGKAMIFHCEKKGIEYFTVKKWQGAKASHLLESIGWLVFRSGMFQTSA